MRSSCNVVFCSITLSVLSACFVVSSDCSLIVSSVFCFQFRSFVVFIKDGSLNSSHAVKQHSLPWLQPVRMK